MSNATAGPSTSHNAATTPANPVNPAKLAKNKRLPATMITPQGQVAPSKKSGKAAPSKKKKRRIEEGKEKALERSGKLEEKVKSREEKRVRFNRLIRRPAGRGSLH